MLHFDVPLHLHQDRKSIILGSDPNNQNSIPVYIARSIRRQTPMFARSRLSTSPSDFRPSGLYNVSVLPGKVFGSCNFLSSHAAPGRTRHEALTARDWAFRPMITFPLFSFPSGPQALSLFGKCVPFFVESEENIVGSRKLLCLPPFWASMQDRLPFSRGRESASHPSFGGPYGYVDCRALQQTAGPLFQATCQKRVSAMITLLQSIPPSIFVSSCRSEKSV